MARHDVDLHPAGEPLEHPNLHALITQRADPGIIAHVGACAACRARVRLFRDAHPSTLADAQPQHGKIQLTTGVERYVDMGQLHRGGMGEVHRVFDRTLGRVVVMKRMLPEQVGSAERFFAEARGTARLQHPGIVPVHDVGELPDGRLYYTMEEVVGRTLTAVIADVHDAVTDRGWRLCASGWTLRGLIEVVRKTAETMAFAHNLAVVHRDLKPDNIMVGAFGVVRVVDWGLARTMLAPDPTTDAQPSPARPGLTRPGTFGGTPAYMAPEQAIDGLQAAGPSADVYSLGAILYQVLSGSPPYGNNASLAAVRGGPAAPCHPAASVPDTLLELCERALARDPAARFADAGAFAQAMGGWLDDARAEDKARECLEQANHLAEAIASLISRAEDLERKAAAGLKDVEDHAPVEQREPSWAQQDEAIALRRDAATADAEQGLRLQEALAAAPALPAARDALVRWYQGHILESERQGRPEDVARWERLLRELSFEDASQWLDGLSAVRISTHPEGAQVYLQTYKEVGRRLVLDERRPVGTTPLPALALPRGSHRLELHHPDRDPAWLPIAIERGGQWSHTRPGDAAPKPVQLLPKGSLGPNDCYVPAGWARLGSANVGYQPVWVDGFVIQRFPVTNAEFLDWLNRLVDEGRTLDAERWQPRDRGSEPTIDGPAIYTRTGSGQFALAVDNDGDAWEPDVPVCMLKIDAVEAYAADLAQRSGLPWRLPHDLEWEKAARGVDARRYPFGNHGNATWMHTAQTRPGKPLPASIHACPIDESPYGVRGLGGGICDWTADLYAEATGLLIQDNIAIVRQRPASDAYRAIRGGCWVWHHQYSTCDIQYGHGPTGRTATVGFRLVRSV